MTAEATDRKKVAFYARVSTLKEQTTENQVHALKKFIQTQPYRDCAYDVYEEHGVSGRKVRPADRPAFSQLLEKCKAGEYSHILVLRIDRLCRNIRDLYEIMQELRELNIEVIFSQQSIPTSGPLGKLVLGVIGLVAEFEADLIAERVKEGMAVRKKQGAHMGRRKNEIPLEIISAAEKRVAAGEALYRVAKELGVSEPTLRRRLHK